MRKEDTLSFKMIPILWGYCTCPGPTFIPVHQWSIESSGYQKYVGSGHRNGGGTCHRKWDVFGHWNANGDRLVHRNGHRLVHENGDESDHRNLDGSETEGVRTPLEAENRF